jgi:S1-C subfamily serine protease
MPDPDQTGFSRVCPSCGRRVPRSVGMCRCGKPVPFEDDDTTEQRKSTPAVALILPLIAMIAAGFAWYRFFPPADPAPITPRHSIGPPPRNDGFLDPIALGPPRAAPKGSAEPIAAPAAPAMPAPAVDSREAAIEDVVARVMPAVVQIETTGPRGSGFFVAYDTLITNVHVVNDDGYVTIKSADGRTATARVDKRSPSFDLAVLKIAQPSVSQPFIPMGTIRTMRTGQEVIAIGSPLGTFQNSVTRGVASGMRTAGGATLIQHDAAMNPGGSGGPLLDRQGRVIGVNSMTYVDKPGIGFAVAIDHVVDLLAGRLQDGGTTRRGLDDVLTEGRVAESDRQKQQGGSEFAARVKQHAETAREFDTVWKSFRERCYTSPISGRYDRGWFALLAPNGLPAGAGASCADLYADMQFDAREFRDRMRRIVDAARRANVLPGTIREELRTNRLDFEWDK